MIRKLLLVLVACNLTACGFEIVDTGNRGITTRFGEVVGEPLPEGLHFYNPLTSDITEYTVREQSWDTETSIFTKDNQTVKTAFTTVYYADPAKVHTLFQKFGNEEALVSKVIKPVILGSIKDAIGTVIADELVSKREMVTKTALDNVKRNLEERGVIVTDLQFTNLDFEDAYEQAAEQKVVAIQQAQKAKNDTVKIEEEGKQIVLTAKAEAESMQIKSKALAQNKGLIEFEMVQKWDGKMSETLILGGNSSNSSMPMLQLIQKGKGQ